jgi:hypothetical protein
VRGNALWVIHAKKCTVGEFKILKAHDDEIWDSIKFLSEKKIF